MAWKQGDTLQGGKYVIEKVLGEGGFGITYKARHVLFDEWVVIKTPNSSLQKDPEYPKFVQRFIKEGQTLAKLAKIRHPHIVRVSDLFREGKLPCLVMDFIEGESLLEMVQRKGALPEAEAIGYIRQIGSALMVVHAEGLVHRDAHPGNIMIPKPGEAILIDFGIVGDIFPITRSSKSFGNPAFAPVEQFFGGRKPTVDIYTLAASLSYAVTGQIPQRNEDQLIPPKRYYAGISEQLSAAIVAGMALQASQRPQTMQEWLNLLPEKRYSQPSKVVKPVSEVKPPSQNRPVSVTQKSSVNRKHQEQQKQDVEKNSRTFFVIVVALYTFLGFFSAPWNEAVIVTIVAILIWSGISFINGYKNILFKDIPFFIGLSPTFFISVFANGMWTDALDWSTAILFVPWFIWLFAFIGISMFVVTWSTKTFHSYLFLVTASWLGLGIGWLVYQIFPVLEKFQAS